MSIDYVFSPCDIFLEACTNVRPQLAPCKDSSCIFTSSFSQYSYFFLGRKVLLQIYYCGELVGLSYYSHCLITVVSTVWWTFFLWHFVISVKKKTAIWEEKIVIQFNLASVFLTHCGTIYWLRWWTCIATCHWNG